VAAILVTGQRQGPEADPNILKQNQARGRLVQGVSGGLWQPIEEPVLPVGRGLQRQKSARLSDYLLGSYAFFPNTMSRLETDFGA
jgi:hypothetical protein